MVRTLATPDTTALTIKIPDEMIGKNVQVILAYADEAIPEFTPEQPRPRAEDAFKAFRVALGSDYKFDRDEAALC